MSNGPTIQLSDYVKLPASEDPHLPPVINPGKLGADIAARLVKKFTAEQLQDATLDVTNFRPQWLISAFFRRFFKTLNIEMPGLVVDQLSWLTKHDFQRQNISLWNKCHETIFMEYSAHDAPVVTHALCKRLAEVRQELVVLRLSRERNLTREERWQLPANLQRLSREELQEQIDPWITLEDTLDDLITQMAKAEKEATDD